ncbi:MAG: ATP-dependent Clp protease proteolytic subunit [Candidatus Eremiobacteraeota bacterium]|nr:ATP-dependent Clp protease proteolytic subunit [Candidatus Eremiobacteraeota bacterium]
MNNEKSGKLLAEELMGRLIKERIILIEGTIDDDYAGRVIDQLEELEAVDEKKGIDMYLNSPGGSAQAALAICDAIKRIAPPVTTICLEKACCGAAIILACGARRFALPHSQILLYQPLFIQGVSDGAMESAGKQIVSAKEKIISILAKATGKEPSLLRKEINTDRILTAREAVELGVIDRVLPGAPSL